MYTKQSDNSIPPAIVLHIASFVTPSFLRKEKHRNFKIRVRKFMNTTNWKIAEQSKQHIAEALLCLMNTYTFKEITITQIAGEADLSRKTFYRLFSDKESVIKYLLEEKSTVFISMIKEQQIQHYWDMVKCFFSFWEGEKKLLLLLKKHNLLYLVNEVSYHYSLSVFETVRSKETASYFADNLSYLLAYSLGGMHSLLLKWIEEDMVTDYNIFIDILHKGFQSVDI